MSIGTKEYENQLNRIYKKTMKVEYRLHETDFGCVDESFEEKGVCVAYHGDKKKKSIKLNVHPGLVIGDDLSWEPSPRNISTLLAILEKLIASYFRGRFTLYDFKLSRVDLATDMNIGNPSKVSDYMKILYSLGRVKCFSPLKRDVDGEKIKKECCFALKGNSNGIEFWAYQLKHRKNILRIEVRLTKPPTIGAYSAEPDTSKLIRDLSKNGEYIFMDVFQYVIPPGNHYKKPKAEKLIWERVRDNKMRYRMIHLLGLIPEKKSLHLAQKSLQYRDVMGVMVEFTKINVSPITISKRHDVKRLDSLYGYLEN